MDAPIQQPDDTAASRGIRSTQRPPKSCSFCYRRKIKCDREFPCRQCRRRGVASSCRIEPVMVKGRLIQYVPRFQGQSHSSGFVRQVDKEARNRDEIMQRSYTQVVQENAELRSRSAEVLYREDLIDEKEQLLFADLRNHRQPRGVRSAADVLLPSTQCSSFLFGREGPQSWLHLAIDWAEFRNQRQEFEESCRQGLPPTSAADPAWLSLYFGCLVAQLTFVSDEDARLADLPHENVTAALHNWYDSALFFLYQSDFLSVFDIRTVQAIIILDVAFTNHGDLNLYSSLWACAARISQNLRINLEEKADDACVSQRNTRIWWALVLTDWLSGQLNQPCIRKDDFSIKVPQMTCGTDAPVLPENVSSQYFACMARISHALYRFRVAISSVTQDESTTLPMLVQNADNELAEIISQLPAHLSAYDDDDDDNDDNGAASSTRAKRLSFSQSLEWQKQSIAVALLYYRLVVNRAPLRDTTSDGLSLKRARAIYLSSAHAIIDLITKSSLHHMQFQIWTFQLALYSSAAAVIANLGSCACALSIDAHKDQALASIAFLKKLAGRSVLAEYAVANLINMLHEQELKALGK